MENNMLEEKKNNYIMSIIKKGMFYGVAVCDVSTGDFLSCEIKDTNNFEKLLDEIARFTPAEIIINKDLANSHEEVNKIKQRFNVYTSFVEDSYFDEDYEKLENEFQINEKIKDKLFCVTSSNALIKYLRETRKKYTRTHK